ncbi:MAG: ATP12 family protein [Rhizobiaceae bacterium]
MRDIFSDRDPATPKDPMRVAQPSRESQLPKRFYESVSIRQDASVFQVLLDGKPIRTPRKTILSVENETVANTMADEWSAQKERIDPMTMPVTRLINTAIDGVALDMQAVKEDIIRYSGTDMLCYRVSEPQGLVTLQIEYWDPLLDWAQSALGAQFELAEGIIHIEQSPEAIASFSAHVGMIDNPIVLAATHVVMALTGSAIIAMAALKDHITLDDAWRIAHLDEDWNIEQWGTDEEAQERRAKRFTDMKAAYETIRAYDTLK